MGGEETERPRAGFHLDPTRHKLSGEGSHAAQALPPRTLPRPSPRAPASSGLTLAAVLATEAGSRQCTAWSSTTNCAPLRAPSLASCACFARAPAAAVGRLSSIQRPRRCPRAQRPGCAVAGSAFEGLAPARRPSVSAAPRAVPGKPPDERPLNTVMSRRLDLASAPLASTWSMKGVVLRNCGGSARCARNRR